MGKRCPQCRIEKNAHSFRQWYWYDMDGGKHTGPRMPTCALCYDILKVSGGVTPEESLRVQMQVRREERALKVAAKSEELRRKSVKKAEQKRGAKRKEERRVERLRREELLAKTPENKREAHSQNLIEQELLQRELSRRSLIEFIKQFNPNYEAGWVHEDICRRLAKFLNAMKAGQSPRLMLFMPPRHGKKILDSVAIYTYNRGLITHGELQVNDLIQHPSGTPTKIVGVGPKSDINYEISFSDGSKIKCHAQHEWRVYSRPDARWLTVETQWFAQNTKRGTPRKLTSGTIGKRGGRYLYQLPLVEGPVQMSMKKLPLDPYFLGVWLGDGSKTAPVICFDPRRSEHIDKIIERGLLAKERRHSQSAKYEYVAYASFTGQGVVQRLRDIELYDNKHIPRLYLEGDVTQRLELLAGLIDSDGHVDKHGRVRFSNTNKRLIDGCFELCQSLNLRPYCAAPAAPTTSSSGIKGTKPVYQIGFQPPPKPYCPAIPTVVKKIVRTVKQKRLAVTSVREINTDEIGSGHCIQVEAKDGLYLAGKTLIPTHNSMIASHNFPAWALGQYPEYEIIAASYGSSLPNKFSRQVRAFLRDIRYKRIFPETKLDPTNENVEGWSTTKGGGYIPAGVGGGITGKGAHIFIVDDPIKDAEEADSETIRQNIWDWWGSTAYTRLAPNAGVLVIQTRWHDDDLSGRMIMQMREELREAGEIKDMNVAAGMTPEAADKRYEQALREIDQWEIIDYPAEATEDEYLNRDGTVTTDPTDKNSKFLRNKGDALHPERFDHTRLMKIKRTLQPRHWSALYQQNPIPDEGMFFTKNMMRYDLAPDPARFPVCMAWDLAVGQKQQNDYTVGVVGCLDYYDRLIVLEIIRAKMNIHQSAEAILGLYDKYNRMIQGNPIIGIEHGQLSLSMQPHLDKVMDEQRLFPSFDDELKPISDKMHRAGPLQGRMQQGKVVFAKGESWVEDVEHELLRFPGGVHDDIVDALAWLARMFTKVSVPKRQEPAKIEKSWRNRLIIPGKHTPMSA